MPWSISSDHADCNGFAVVKKSDGSLAGCHETREDAERQLAALYAKEPAMAAVGAGGGACGCETSPRGEVVEDPFGEDLATTLLAAVRSPYMDSVMEGRRARRAILAAAMEPLDALFPVPAYPPREWFEGPPEWVAPWRAAAGLKAADDGGILRLTITDEGRIGGWFFNAGQCLVHDPSACPKHSPTRYAAFHQSDVLCADGTMLDVGVIGMTHGHQSPWLDWKEAQRLYADPTAQKILCVAGDTEHGGWIAGAVVPGSTYADVALMRRSGLSGDWRPMPQSWWDQHGITPREVRQVEGYDCIGPTLVTRPALPLVRNFSMNGRAAAILGGSAGIDLDVSRFARRDRERITLLAATDPELSRFTRRAYTFDESAVQRDEGGRFTFKDGGGTLPGEPKATHRDPGGPYVEPPGREGPGGVIPDLRPQLDYAGKFDFGQGDAPPIARYEPVTLPNRISLYSDDVQALIDANPQRSGEDNFAYQGRLVAELDPQTASDVIYEMRETYEPVGFVNEGLDRWNEENGLRPLPENIAEIPADLAEANEIARFFETAEDQSDDPAVRAAYDDFKDQNARMYDFMTRPESEGGMGIRVEFTDETDPYPTARAQAEDIEENKRIVIERGLGGEHSLLTQDEYDRFRAVHDVFGHAAIGGGFDRHGEYQAWLTHASMYDDPGRLAMSTEYHGVNSAAWSGEPGSPGTGKAVLLPGEFGIPPWERSDYNAEEQAKAAAARVAAAWPTPDDPNAEGVKAVIALLKIDEDFTRKFDHPAWHYAQPILGTFKRIGAETGRQWKPRVGGVSRFARRAYTAETFDESLVVREHGRFAKQDSGGGEGEATHSTGAPGEVDTTTANLREDAAVLADRAHKAEQQVTAALQGMLPEGAEFLGFENRLKGEGRMAEKLGEKHAEGLSDEEAMDAIGDALRYTIGDSPDRYNETARETITELQRQGFTLVKEPKDYWERGDAYSGVNTQWRTPDGQRFELQFHTPESYDTVQRIHPDYDVYRTSTDPQLRAELWDRMAAAWEGVEVPPGVEGIGERIFERAAAILAAVDMTTHYYKTEQGRYFRRRRDETGQYLEILEEDGTWTDLPSLIGYLTGQDDGAEEIDALPPDVQQAAASRFVRRPSRFTRRAYTFDESAVVRDTSGRFTFKDGGDGNGESAGERGTDAGDESPSGGGGSSLAEKFVQGEHVTVPAEEVATFTDRLAEFLEDQKQTGAGGKLNLCEVSVPGTNLFCQDNQGYTRLDMPQLIGIPEPGSKADRLPKDEGGAADIQGAFTDRLAEMGVDITNDVVPSASLKATQAELRSDKSVGIAQGIRDGKVDIEGGDRIFVSNDGYILDGHHRWAGAILNDFEDGHVGDARMPVARIDLPIRDLVDLANEFAGQMGIAPAGTSGPARPAPPPVSGTGMEERFARERAGMSTGGETGMGLPLRGSASRFARRAGWFREEDHERDDSGKFTDQGGGGGEPSKEDKKAAKEAEKAEKREKKQDDRDRHTVEFNLARHNSFFKTLGGFADRDIILRENIPRPVLRDLGEKALSVRYDEEAAATLRKEILDRGLDDHAEQEGRAMKAAIPARPAATVRASQEGTNMDRFILMLPDGSRVDTAYSDVRVAALTRVASVTAAGDLPVAAPETPWDEATAKANLLEASGGDEAMYGRGFLFHDDTQTGPESYYWPIADVVDGQVAVVPAAVDSALAAIADGTIGELTDEEKDATLAILHTYAPVAEDVADAAEMLASMQAELKSLRARVDAHDEFRDAEMRHRAAAIVAGEKPLPMADEEDEEKKKDEEEEPLPVA